ncbi:MAG TPA: hypothetical protein VH395_00100, partial [Jatrophihabitantaceae bacterium]
SYLVDGQKLPGVTTILGATLAKPALIEWAGKTTANYAVDFWDELCELTPSKRLDRLNRARFEEKDAAAKRGTEVHRLAEHLVAGVKVDVPEELVGHVEAYVDFLNTWEPEPVMVELVLANRTVGYCGTADLVADLHGTRWLLDVKTARSGIFGETALQCCAYAKAEVFLGDDGQEHPMSELGPIQRVGAIHVRADGWDLRPLVSGEEVWSTFRHLAWLYRQLERVDQMRDWVGPAITPMRAVS